VLPLWHPTQKRWMFRSGILWAAFLWYSGHERLPKSATPNSLTLVIGFEPVVFNLELRLTGAPSSPFGSMD
jgi:hypothetical protein